MEIIEQAKANSLSKAVLLVNNFVNNLPYIAPPDEWKFNRWRSPELTLKEGGNCLDKAALKMWIMVEAGFDKELFGIGTVPKHAFLIYKAGYKKWCFSKPITKEWIADINYPHIRLLNDTKLNDAPYSYDEAMQFIAFDLNSYYKAPQSRANN